MLRPFQQSYHVPGALIADLTIMQKIAMNCVLREVSAVASSDTDGLISLTNGDAVEYLAASAIGPESVPAVYGAANFLDGVHPHLVKDQLFEIVIEFDGDSGTAAADLTVVLTFEEG